MCDSHGGPIVDGDGEEVGEQNPGGFIEASREEIGSGLTRTWGVLYNPKAQIERWKWNH